jgi:exonuclease VII large subunit
MTDAQQARIEARAHAYVREVMADCEAHEATLRTIRRETMALKAAMERRAKRIERARSVATIQALYAEQREDLHRLCTRVEEGLDTDLALQQLRICFRDVALSERPRTLEAYREVQARLHAVVDQTESTREANAAYLAECLAGLEARERDDIAWIRQQINQRYALPARPWRAS